MKNLKLFIMEECPYCNKVIKHMEANDINVEIVDINADPNNKEELIKLGGKYQVPMLQINENSLYESDDIIDWLKENM